MPAVSIIIPARDEALNIRDALGAINRVDYPRHRLEVLVVDDHSSDETAAIVSQFAAENEGIRLLQAPPLPQGWSGKANACQHGADAASGDWLVFIDADTFVRPGLIRAAISEAQEGELALLSLIPFQIIGSFQERISLPAIFLAFASVMNFNKVNNPQQPQAVANGQFLLFSRAAYGEIGGHRAVREELSDDLAFARRAKSLRMRFRCLFADELVETRMYRSLAEVWGGFTRNAVDIMFTTSPLHAMVQASRSLVLACGLVAFPLSAAAMAEQGGGVALYLGGVTMTVLLVSFTMMLRELRLSPLYLLAMPFGFLMHALIVLSSYRKKQKGRRSWKGRTNLS